MIPTVEIFVMLLTHLHKLSPSTVAGTFFAFAAGTGTASWCGSF